MDALLIYKDRKFVGKQLLRGNECILGRGGDIVLDSPQVSRRHAAIRRRAGRFFLLDLGSANGTFLNRAPVATANVEEPLHNGDQIELGEFQIRCIFAGSDERMTSECAAAPEVLERAAPLPPVESLPPTVKRKKTDVESGNGNGQCGASAAIAPAPAPAATGPAPGSAGSAPGPSDPAPASVARAPASPGPAPTPAAPAAAPASASATPAPALTPAAPAPGTAPSVSTSPGPAPAAPAPAPAGAVPAARPPAGGAAPRTASPAGRAVEHARRAPATVAKTTELPARDPGAAGASAPVAAEPAPPAPPALAVASPGPAEGEVGSGTQKLDRAEAAAVTVSAEARPGAKRNLSTDTETFDVVDLQKATEAALASAPAVAAPTAAAPALPSSAKPPRNTATIKAFSSNLERLDALQQIKTARPRLVISTEELRNTMPIEKIDSSIGRAPENDIAIGHQSVSARHATLRFMGDGFAVIDHHSTNCTFVNGYQIVPEGVVRIEDNTALMFGAVSCLFVCDPAAFPTRARPRRASPERIAQHLVETGVLTRVQARDVLREAAEKGQTLGEMLVLRGFLGPERWAEIYRQSEHFADSGAKRGALGAIVLTSLLAAIVVILALVLLGVIDVRRLFGGST